ncbi:uncharacterized protein LOC142892193 isoform X2 [Nelusetta ayraudi]|uniref:uncharacterized protein LOC142892193 isoform X2 n=1 Tax=Nelusetta ayraudi TaxID=303726 RepID=UPI003F6FEB8A
MPNVTVKRCNTFNPASLMPLPTDGEPHNCIAELETICSPRPDLTDEPFANADFVFYTDGSAFRDDKGTNRVGYAVVTDSEVVCSDSLPCHLSAQGAELVALTEACKFVEGKSVTIYTDSRCAFGVVHDFGALWKCRNFLKSDGKPVLNHGNARADATAKAAARQPAPAAAPMMTTSFEDADASLAGMQSLATAKETATWRSACARWDRVSNIWVGPNDVRRQVSAALPQAATGPLHCLKPGDYVLVKDLRRKSWKANRWLGPFQVLLVTQTAIKVAERATWIHASHCKRVSTGELTKALQKEEGSHVPDHHPTL